MLQNALQNFDVILASGSPRRQYFFDALHIPYTKEVREVDESFPPHLKGAEITDYLATLKASAFTSIKPNQIIVTSDTIVWMNNAALNKPKDRKQATQMLTRLSGRKHQVMTSVCFTLTNQQIVVNDTTDVWFNPITPNEIDYYITHHQPFDKAGSYGIQDWLGYIGIQKIEGCFFNVMGLPTRLVYKTLMNIANRHK